MENTATTQEELLRTQSVTVMDRLIEAGLTLGLADKINCSRGNALAGKMLGVARTGYPAIGERLARRIMGNNMIGGREEWGDFYGVSFTSKMSRVAAKFPLSEEELDTECAFNPGKAVSETHCAFLGLDKYNGSVAEAHGPLTIMGWQKIHPAGGQPRFFSYGTDCWHREEEFASSSIELRWYLALKEVVPKSPGSGWERMQGMIAANYEVPSPVVEVTKNFLYRGKNGVYLNNKHYGATDKLASYDYRVIVGNCNDDNINVNNWNGNANDYVGLSLFRNFLLYLVKLP